MTLFVWGFLQGLWSSEVLTSTQEKNQVNENSLPFTEK